MFRLGNVEDVLQPIHNGVAQLLQPEWNLPGLSLFLFLFLFVSFLFLFVFLLVSLLFTSELVTFFLDQF